MILRHALKKLCLFNLYYFVNGASKIWSVRAWSVFCFLPKYPHWLCTSPGLLCSEYKKIFPHWPSSQGMEMAVHVLLMVRLGMCVHLYFYSPHMSSSCAQGQLYLYASYNVRLCVSSAVWFVMCQKVVHNIDLFHF